MTVGSTCSHSAVADVQDVRRRQRPELGVPDGQLVVAGLDGHAPVIQRGDQARDEVLLRASEPVRGLSQALGLGVRESDVERGAIGHSYQDITLDTPTAQNCGWGRAARDPAARLSVKFLSLSLNNFTLDPSRGPIPPPSMPGLTFAES